MNISRALVGGELVFFLISSPALVKADISYPDLTGTTMQFSYISESSGTDPVPLYGQPRVSGNSLIFSHMSFSSSAANGASDITDGQLNLEITSDGGAGHYIDRITFRESGDTTLAGTGTPNTYSTTGIDLFLTIWQVNYTDFTDFDHQTPSTNVVFGTWTLPPPTSQLWNGSLTFDVTAYLQSVGDGGRATDVSISSDNKLATASEVGTSAFIDKKTEGLTITVETVPEPSSLCLLILSGTLLLIGRFGRKS